MNGMVSIGDYRWVSNVEAKIYNEDQELIDEIGVYAKDIHRGNSAQTTASLGFGYWILPDIKIGADIWHGSNIYADFNVQNRADPDEEGVDSWEMPDYQLLDANIKYEFEIAGTEATLYGNVSNLLDTEYISDAKDGTEHDAASAIVWYGWGRTWNLSLKIKF
jgi:outer membrane receptor protein involved in Fe transport